MAQKKVHAAYLEIRMGEELIILELPKEGGELLSINLKVNRGIIESPMRYRKTQVYVTESGEVVVTETHYERGTIETEFPGGYRSIVL